MSVNLPSDEQRQEISNDYIRGLVDGEGSFTFCPVNNHTEMIPTFSLNMTTRDHELIKKVRSKMKLYNTVYRYPPRIKPDGYKRQGMSILIVRDTSQIKIRVIPFFYKKLIGHKAVQFEEWIEKMESDPLVPERFKIIPKMYKYGFYEKNYIVSQ